MFSNGSMRISLSPIEEIMERVTGDSINLAGGSPDPTTIPVNEIRNAFDWVCANYGSAAFVYPGAGGLTELRNSLLAYTGSLGIEKGETVITSGAQHALTLISEVLLHDDRFVHEDPGFVEGVNSFLFSSRNQVPITVDGRGLNTNEFEEILKKGATPKAAYVVPTCQNPTGTIMDEDRRKHLVELAERYDFIIIEDDPYRPVSHENPTPLYNMASDRVVYVGSLSKILAPGLRIGFVLTRNRALAERVKVLEQLDFSISTSNQLLTARLLSTGIVNSRIPELREKYRRKLRILLDGLADSGIKTVYEPRAGFFTLVDVGQDARDVAERALSRGVATVPATHFYYRTKPKNYLRLSIGPAAQEKIEEGVRILKQSLLAR
jgi:2-aminoadipate transaminase